MVLRMDAPSSSRWSALWTLESNIAAKRKPKIGLAVLKPTGLICGGLSPGFRRHLTTAGGQDVLSVIRLSMATTFAGVSSSSSSRGSGEESRAVSAKVGTFIIPPILSHPVQSARLFRLSLGCTCSSALRHGSRVPPSTTVSGPDGVVRASKQTGFSRSFPEALFVIRFDGAAGFCGLRTGKRDGERGATILCGRGWVPLGCHCRMELVECIVKGLIIAFEKEVFERLASDGAGLVPAYEIVVTVVERLHHPLVAKDFHPLVESVGTAAAVVDVNEGSRRHPERRHGHVEIALGADPGVEHAGAGRHDLDRTFAGNPAYQVDIVDRGIDEISARGPDIVDRRWAGFARPTHQHGEPLHLAPLHRRAQGRIVRIEATVETQHEGHGVSVKRRHGSVHTLKRLIKRLFAIDRLARAGGGFDIVDMCVEQCGDHDRVDLWVGKHRIQIAHRAPAILPGGFFSRCHAGVIDDLEPQTGMSVDLRTIDMGHASGAHEGQSKRLHQARSLTSSRIKAAAFSPIMIAAALVFPVTMRGMIEASATRNPSIPWTRRRGTTTESSSTPILQVPTGCRSDKPLARQ